MRLLVGACALQALLLAGLTTQELLVRQFGVSVPFLFLSLCFVFTLCLKKSSSGGSRLRAQRIPTPVVPVFVSCLFSILWLLLVQALWLRDTILLTRGRSEAADDSLLDRLDRQVFPQLSLWGCQEGLSAGYKEWRNLSPSCLSGHLILGTLTLAALVVAVSALAVAITQVRWRADCADDENGDPHEQNVLPFFALLAPKDQPQDGRV